MRTLLSQFCEEFEEAVHPLLEPLQACATTIGESSPALGARQVLPRLLELRHQLQQLSEKVAGQQAYVLIFGPLKSGKSTLMNAVAAAYVSEVSCLPAYPCMVFVSHAPSREFVITRYDGRSETFNDPTGMRMHVTRAHNELASRIREVEKQGETFDPATHFPEAIRRIDVKLPARSLEKSSAVLVDTPGLYSRMRFGYDRMTREFRNSAACAIFVVKTDNLFLEQVFEEFNQLLELFSRIFLVVNLDTQKQDLRPDGSLAPSLEREDPVRVIEAFENLAMSAPLKAAAEDGRLRIYPVDLQRAATGRLQEVEQPGSEPKAAKQSDFTGFVSDLESYLNSTDYMVAFLVDSLRHARGLFDETDRILQHTAIRELGREVEALETERTRLLLAGDVLSRIEGFDWPAAFSRLQDELLHETRDRVQALRERSEQALRGVLDEWFSDDSSLESMLEDKVVPLLEEGQNDLALGLHQALSERVGRGQAGLELTENLRDDLGAADIELGVIGRHSLIQIDPSGGVRAETPAIALDELPVRKTFWDWILFRSVTKVRRRLFGDSRPKNRIARAVKQRQLGTPVREALWRQLAQTFDEVLPRTKEVLCERIYGDYGSTVQGMLNEEVTRGRESIESSIDDVETRLREILRISNHIEELEACLARTAKSLEGLTERYGEADPKELAQPVPEPELADVELEPAARGGSSPDADESKSETSQGQRTTSD